MRQIVKCCLLAHLTLIMIHRRLITIVGLNVMKYFNNLLEELKVRIQCVLKDQFKMKIVKLLI